MFKDRKFHKVVKPFVLLLAIICGLNAVDINKATGASVLTKRPLILQALTSATQESATKSDETTEESVKEEEEGAEESTSSEESSTELPPPPDPPQTQPDSTTTTTTVEEIVTESTEETSETTEVQTTEEETETTTKEANKVKKSTPVNRVPSSRPTISMVAKKLPSNLTDLQRFCHYTQLALLSQQEVMKLSTPAYIPPIVGTLINEGLNWLATNEIYFSTND